MKKHLSDLAAVDLGYSFRSRVDRTEDGNVFVIQMKDLADGGQLDQKRMSKVQRSDFKEQYLVKKRDIIFRSRGVTNTAVLLREQLAPAIVAAPLMRIRVNHEGVLPDYLYWFINQKSAQAFFQSRVRGTAQKMIPKQSLEKLVVDVPPMTIQQSIIALAELERREQELIRRIAQKRRRYLEETLTRLAKEPHNEPKD